MFKKFLSMLAGMGITAIASASVVSCIAPQYADGVDGQRVVLATDGGHIDDRAFNEDALRGVKTYVNNEYGLTGNNDYVEASGSTTDAVINGYKMAVVKKANALVMPGFTHMSTIPQASFLKDKSVVLIDGILPDNDNVISVQFNSQIAGFQAGFDAAYWATTKDENGKLQGDANGDGVIKIGTFAGASNKYGVDNYMWGLILGIEVFNETFAKDKSNTDDLREDNRERPYVQFSNSDTGKVKDMKIVNASDSTYWTGSFELGAATKSGVVGRLIDKQKSDIIFPVAGPQIEDVLNTDKYGYKPYVIGVDVDQAAGYPEAAAEGRFVTSAIKNIHSAVEQSLKHAKHLMNTDGSKRTEDIWDGTAPTPFENWSIDYTKKDNPAYKLDKTHLNLYKGDGNVAVDPDKDPIIATINDYFAALGPIADDYMQGDVIITLANEIVDKYGDKLVLEEGDTNE